MKKISALVVIFFVAAAGGYFFKVLRAPKPAAPVDNRLVACDPARVRTIRMERSEKGGAEKIVALRRADSAPGRAFEARVFDQMEWELTEPTLSEADVSLASRLASSFCETTDQVAVTEGSSGDAVPVNRIVVEEETEHGMKWHELSFAGRLEGRQVRVWVGSPAENRQYRVLPRVAGLIDAPAAAYLNRKVARTLPNNVMRAVLEKGGREVFSLDRSGADWQVISGGGKPAVGSGEAEKFVNRLANLAALDVLPGGDVPGCEKSAAYRLTFLGVGGRKEVLSFGAPGNLRGRRALLACSSLRKSAFLVHPDLIQYIDVGPRRLMAVK
ncbi:MAG: hypothetical protein HUU37_04690 [Bdellovibrionales bacterium]|nr:hypothetical protein [Bdellovibrionales bacterium]